MTRSATFVIRRAVRIGNDLMRVGKLFGLACQVPVVETRMRNVTWRLCTHLTMYEIIPSALRGPLYSVSVPFFKILSVLEVIRVSV